MSSTETGLHLHCLLYLLARCTRSLRGCSIPLTLSPNRSSLCGRRVRIPLPALRCTAECCGAVTLCALALIRELPRSSLFSDRPRVRCGARTRWKPAQSSPSPLRQVTHTCLSARFLVLYTSHTHALFRSAAPSRSFILIFPMGFMGRRQWIHGEGLGSL